MSKPTELPSPGDPQALYIVDLSGYIFRGYYGLPPLSNSRGEPTGAILGTVTMLMKFLRQQEPQNIVLALDSKKPSFRKEVYSDYKANRPAPPEDLESQIQRVMQIMDAFQFRRLIQPGAEADDIIATLVDQAVGGSTKVVIVSADKDLLQLVSNNVMMYDTMRDKVYGIAETQKKLGILPHQVGDYLALVGDTSDNIPGVPSVGPKTAASLLNEYGNISTLYARLDEVTRKALKQKLLAHRADVELSRELVELKRDLDLGVRPEEFAYAGPNVTELKRLFLELEFTRLLDDLSSAEPSTAKLPQVQAGSAADMLRRIHESAPDAVLTLDVWQQEETSYISLGDVEDEQLPLLAIPVTDDNLEDLRAGARALIESQKRTAVVTDLKAAAQRFALLEHASTQVFDLRLVSYLVAVERRDHSLAGLAREFLNMDIGSEVRPPHDAAALRFAVQRTAYLALRKQLEDYGLAKLYAELELPLRLVLAQIEAEGVLIDLSFLRDLSQKLTAQLEKLVQQCWELAGEEFNVGSPRQLEVVLFDKLKLPVVKRTRTARSTDHEVLEELAGQHSLPKVILEQRSLSKLLNTYVDALPHAVDEATGRVHTRLNQTVAATGRLSSSDPNLQNIPIRDAVGRSIRSAFIPRQDWWIFSADYSQVELRVMAHLSRDPILVDAFLNNVDVHQRTACALFDVEPDDVTSEMRGRAKTVNFAVIYGQSAFALAKNLKISRAEASHYINAFFAQYHVVRDYLDHVLLDAKESGVVYTMLGRRRALPDLQSKNRVLRAAAERVARNTPLQGTAADIIKLAMLKIHRRFRAETLASQMILSVHDELVFEVHPDEREKVETLVVGEMEGAAELRVPLLVETGWGKSWGEAH